MKNLKERRKNAKTIKKEIITRKMKKPKSEGRKNEKQKKEEK